MCVKVCLSNANINAQNMQTAKENYVSQAQKCIRTSILYIYTHSQKKDALSKLKKDQTDKIDVDTW